MQNINITHLLSLIITNNKNIPKELKMAATYLVFTHYLSEHQEYDKRLADNSTLSGGLTHHDCKRFLRSLIVYKLPTLSNFCK